MVTKKRSLIYLLIAAMLFVYAGLHFETPFTNGRLSFLTDSAEAADLKDANEPTTQERLSFSEFKTRKDVYELLIGIFVTVLGLVGIALSLLRWKTKNLLLMSFGLIGILNGARSNLYPVLFDASPRFWEYTEWFITYLIPIPGFFFLEQLLGKGWKSSMRRLWQFAIAFAAVTIALASIFQNPPVAATANNIFVVIAIAIILFNLFRPGLQATREIRILRLGLIIFALFAIHGNIGRFIFTGSLARDYEPVGLMVLFFCIIYLVADRFFQNERDLITIASELETARQIQSFILPQEMPQIDGLTTAARYVPMVALAGDFYDFLVIDQKRLGILVADVSGHGVPASLVASMVKIAFAAQSLHADDPVQVLTGINRTLCGKLESDFVTAGYVYVDTTEGRIVYSSAGHMPLLLWRRSDQKIYELWEKGVILGQLEEAVFQNAAMQIEPGDRFIIYTDGIIEASNAAGELFGWERFKEFIRTNASLSVNQFADKLIQDLSKYTGKGAEASLDDDLTLVVVDVESLPG